MVFRSARARPPHHPGLAEDLGGLLVFADADESRLALFLEVLGGGEPLLVVHELGQAPHSVEHEDINVVGAEFSERLVHELGRTLPDALAGSHFADEDLLCADEDFVPAAAAAEEFAIGRLAAAAAVDLRGIEEVHPALEEAREEWDAVRGGVLAAVGDARDHQVRPPEPSVFHAGPLVAAFEFLLARFPRDCRKGDAAPRNPSAPTDSNRNATKGSSAFRRGLAARRFSIAGG